jgi:hypothetical protein
MAVTKLMKIFCFRVRTRKTFNMLYNNLIRRYNFIEVE